MPFYDYYCEANGKTVEVFHKMNERLKRWGQVCKYAKIKLGDTPSDAPVVRLISGRMPIVQKFKGIDKDEPSKKMQI